MQIGKVIGEEPILNAVHAQLEFVSAGRRSNRVSARLLLAVLVWRYRRNKLAGKIVETVAAFNFKHEVIALCNF